MSSEALRTLVLIVAIAVLSPFVSDLVRRWVRLPGVVIEITLGIVIHKVHRSTHHHTRGCCPKVLCGTFA